MRNAELHRKDMDAHPRLSLLQRLIESPGYSIGEETPPLPEGKFLGIVGLSLAEDVWSIADALRMQPVQPRPGSHEITRALSDPKKASVVARYSEHVGYELAIAPEIAVGAEAVKLGRSFISLLRVKALVEILVPAALPCSWSVAILNRLPPQSCDATLIEDNPNAFQLDDPSPVSSNDLMWIFENLSTFDTLCATSPAYSMAVDSLCQHNHQTSLRMAAAMLWSGIEALFDLRSEITFRLAMYIATLLEPASDDRYELFCKVKQEYNMRSRIVHGDSTSIENVRNHIISTRRLLSRLICRITEDQGLPTMTELDRLILGTERSRTFSTGSSNTGVMN